MRVGTSTNNSTPHEQKGAGTQHFAENHESQKDEDASTASKNFNQAQLGNSRFSTMLFGPTSVQRADSLCRKGQIEPIAESISRPMTASNLDPGCPEKSMAMERAGFREMHTAFKFERLMVKMRTSVAS